MRKIRLLGLGFFVMAFLWSSCSSRRNLSYFSDLPEAQTFETTILNTVEAKIQPRDIISITVSSLDPITNSMFNTGIVQEPVNDISRIGEGLGVTPTNNQGYLVDKNGEIDFPVIGKISLQNKGLEEAQVLLLEKISEYVKEPIVSVRFLNFKITVIGEVNKPGTFTINNDQISILEALGLAGDMTVYGKRNNVLLVRQEAGKRIMTRLNLNKKDVFNSPQFYLRQNDVIYVEPTLDRDPSGEKTIKIISTIATLSAAISLIVFRLL